ncbi:MAG: hydrolase [Proteobacteria bacterium]|nr:MAG: hydrolase [Pseudomonadota bacterium]
MLMKADQSVVLVIDLQQRLAPAIHDIESVLRETIWLIHVASRLRVPVLATEQYPNGLGNLVPQIEPLIPRQNVVSKLRFSAATDGCLDSLADASRPQVVIAGIESHVCVLQTALEFRELGRDVFVVAEAVGSRKPADRKLALRRLQNEGIRVVSREMAAFEWMREAGTETFRQISREFLR